ncbi:MAG: hypothetical protein WBD27_06565 [Pyrinomonadaceae bacterium]
MTDSVTKRHIEPLFLSKDKRPESAVTLKCLIAGIMALLVAGLIAMAVYRINVAFAGQPEKAVKIVGILFAILVVIPPGIYLAARRVEARLDNLGLLIVGSVSVLLVASYFFYASFYIALPADIVIWSESDFVNDILKFRVGYPLFTEQVNNESFTYVPGSQIVTYFFAWLAGQPLSVPTYRTIQLAYTFLTTVVAFLSCRRLVRMTAGPAARISDSLFWGVPSFCILFLIAVNSITNPFSHLLHNDALAQLFIVTAFWLVLEYETTRDNRILWLMALVPAVGFWVKQSLVIWAPLYFMYLLVFDKPRPFKRVLGFGLASFAGSLLSFLIGYALWQDNFVYWTFTVLGSHAVSPLRSFRHLLVIWPFFVLGLIAGGTLVQSNEHKHIVGPWMIWLALISIEIYTSGIAWMTNHIGPGCLIAGVLFIAAATNFWSKAADSALKSAPVDQRFRAGICIVAFCLLFSGLGLVRIPAPPFSEEDASRYMHQIENEFADQPPDRVLLDVGTWVYLREGIVMKDRAPSIGERGVSETGDFSGILGRLQERFYKKILVRNFHSGDFWYDHELWAKSSMIRNSLNENYREIGRIKAVSGMAPADLPYGFNEISILVPRDD